MVITHHLITACMRKQRERSWNSFGSKRAVTSNRAGFARTLYSGKVSNTYDSRGDILGDILDKKTCQSSRAGKRQVCL